MDLRYLMFILAPIIPIVLFTENPIMKYLDRWMK